MSTIVNKAQLYMDSIHDQQSVLVNNCMTIQRYEYCFTKSRKKNGDVYNGNPLGSVMYITLNVGSKDSLKVFYSRTKMFTSSLLSIIFHPIFNEHGIMTTYANAMLIDGSIVSIDEQYDGEEAFNGSQMTIKIGILVQGISYKSHGGYNISYNF